MADQKEIETDKPAPAVPKKSGGKFLMIGGGVVLLCLIGGGAYYWGASSATVAEAAEAADAEVAAPAAATPELPGGIVSLEPFVVNLAAPDSSRFLRVTIELGVATPDAAKALDGDVVRQTRTRAAIIDVLTQQMADRLTTTAGKAALKTELMAAIAPAVAPTPVMDVLFTDFVIQF